MMTPDLFFRVCMTIYLFLYPKNNEIYKLTTFLHSIEVDRKRVFALDIKTVQLASF